MTSQVLEALVDSIQSTPLARAAGEGPQMKPYGPVPEPNPEPNAAITQEWIWPSFGAFLREGDLVVVETGTSAVGFGSTPLPKGATSWTQEVFGSIGYATGAMVGASVAHKEGSGDRSILITGDGSLQLPIQEFDDLLRNGTNPHM